MKTITKKIVQEDKCENCIYLESKEYTPNKGFPLSQLFFHCTKTDLYVRGFYKWQSKMNNEEQLKLLFKYCPLLPQEREFLECNMEIIEESEIDEDVIPKVKSLRTELFGEKYE